MHQPLRSLPVETITVDAAAGQGPLEVWRHALSQGGINPAPLPAAVETAITRLGPRLIRVFLQEYFGIYPDHNRFDWSRLDPYMEGLARTGAKIVAAITIKPPVLFPTVDHAAWQPNDVPEWQRVIHALVERYSVNKPIVTHWEVGNETDIGEPGGAPYLIPDAASYAAFYRMTLEPILAAFPNAKVGGPAACWVENEPLPGFVAECRQRGTRLDFVSWHLYSDDPRRHALGVERAKAMLADFPGRKPELLVTEWSTGFEHGADPGDGFAPHTGRIASVEEMALEPRRAAVTAAAIVAMTRAGVDWSFYYHVWDQVFEPDLFRLFFSEAGRRAMLEHWNEVPHRFGLFGVGGEVRPQYFVYHLLGRLSGELVPALASDPDTYALAGRSTDAVSVLVARPSQDEPRDVLTTIHFANVTPGHKRLSVWRIDRERRWDPASLEMRPVERRPLYAPPDFRCQIYTPADSVVMIRLEDAATVGED